MEVAKRKASMAHTKTCLYCGNEFEAARKDARFDSPACRKAYQRTTESTISQDEKAQTKKYTVEDYQKAYGLRPTTYLPFAPLQIPENVVNLWYGKKGSGKSTVALGVAKATALAGKRVLFVDSEAAITDERLAQLQIPPEYFNLVRISHIEDLYELLTQDDNVEGYHLIVVDGIERLSFLTEADNDANSANIGVKARILNKIFRLINVKYYHEGITSIFVNHERVDINGMGHYVPGGEGQVNASSHTLRFYTTAKSRFQKNGAIAGQYAHVKVMKSRFMSPHQEFKLKVTYETAEVEDAT